MELELKTLTDELTEIYGRRMSIAQVSKEIGVKSELTTRHFLQGLPVLIINGDGERKTRRFKTSDVAKRIYESEVVHHD